MCLFGDKFVTFLLDYQKIITSLQIIINMFLRSLPNLFRSIGNLRSLNSCQCSKPSGASQLEWMLSHNPALSNPSLNRLFKNHHPNILDRPIPLFHIIRDMPVRNILPFEDKVITNMIYDPTEVIEQKAARLIVIRRKKMKRHKLKKLRKKMKFIWGKVRQRREMRKEKAFQAELMGQIGEAEKFNAAVYAKEKLDKANAVIIPKLWKGKRLPEFVIKDLLLKEESKKKLRAEDLKRRKSMSIKVSDY